MYLKMTTKKNVKAIIMQDTLTNIVFALSRKLTGRLRRVGI